MATGIDNDDELLGGVEFVLLLLFAARGVGTGVFIGFVHDLGGESATLLDVLFVAEVFMFEKQPGARGDMTPVDEQVDDADEVGVKVALVLS